MDFTHHVKNHKNSSDWVDTKKYSKSHAKNKASDTSQRKKDDCHLKASTTSIVVLIDGMSFSDDPRIIDFNGRILDPVSQPEMS